VVTAKRRLTPRFRHGIRLATSQVVHICVEQFSLREVTMVYDGTLLESIEGLGDPPLVVVSGEIWQRLQDEKSEVSQTLLDEGRLLHDQVNAGPEADASDEVLRELEWKHRAQLESRLRDIGEAQDRLIEGLYGRCTDCGEEIDCRRLAADPAATLCLSCQKTIEGTLEFCSL
jgi:DnaK suppressor protein